MLRQRRARRRARGARVRRGAAVPPTRRSTPRSRCFTVHHWTDLERGLARAAARRAPPGDLLSSSRSSTDDFWLVADYFPEIVDARLRARRARPRPASRECSTCAASSRCRCRPTASTASPACYWNRPEAYLDPDRAGGHLVLRAARSRRARARHRAAARAISQSGAWDARHGDLRDAARDRRRLPAARRRRADRYPDRRAAPRPPEGFARTGDPPTVRGRRPRGRALLRRRLPRHDRRPARRRRHDPAAAGDPALRRRRPVRPRRHRPRLDRGDRASRS